MYNKTIANIILNGENVTLIQILFNVNCEVLVRTIQQMKEIQEID